MSDLLISELIDKGLNEIPQGYKENQAYPFKPVRCNEADLEKIQPINGFVYFTLDTQKIFYGTGTEFLPMGGNSGLFYAHKTFEDPADTMFLAETFTRINKIAFIPFVLILLNADISVFFTNP